MNSRLVSREAKELLLHPHGMLLRHALSAHVFWVITRDKPKHEENTTQ
jgi:hypothetical protein